MANNSREIIINHMRRAGVPFHKAEEIIEKRDKSLIIYYLKLAGVQIDTANKLVDALPWYMQPFPPKPKPLEESTVAPSKRPYKAAVPHPTEVKKITIEKTITKEVEVEVPVIREITVTKEIPINVITETETKTVVEGDPVWPSRVGPSKELDMVKWWEFAEKKHTELETWTNVAGYFGLTRTSLNNRKKEVEKIMKEK
jgi:hypothetical protein